MYLCDGFGWTVCECVCVSGRGVMFKDFSTVFFHYHIPTALQTVTGYANTFSLCFLYFSRGYVLLLWLLMWLFLLLLLNPVVVVIVVVVVAVVDIIRTLGIASAQPDLQKGDTEVLCNKGILSIQRFLISIIRASEAVFASTNCNQELS